MASIGRYILTPDIFKILRNQPTGAGGEIQLADAINVQAEMNSVEAVAIKGRRFDCGSIPEVFRRHYAYCRSQR